MNFNDDDNDNRNINNGEIDFDQINRTSANVRFYNRVIWASIFIIILAGAGCGIYLYSYISSGIKNEIVRPEPEIKKSEKAVKEGTTAHGPVPVQERPAAAASANKSHLAQPEPAATHRGHPGSEKTASVILKQQPAAQTTLKPVSPPAAVSVAATSEVAAAVSHGAPATSETAVSKETAGVEIVLAAVAGETKGTAEVSAAEVYKPDVSLLEKKLARANYSEFETEALRELAQKSIDDSAASRINLLLAKYYYYIKNSNSQSQKHLLKIKNIIAAGASEYAFIYFNLFSSVSRLRCAQLLKYINDNPAVNLTDTEKIEMAKSLVKNGLFEDASRILNRVIASSNFEAEIKYLKSEMSKFGQGDAYQQAVKSREEADYTIDFTARQGAGNIVKIVKTPVIKFKNSFPVSCILSEEKGRRALYAYCSDLNFYEVDLMAPAAFKKYAMLDNNQSMELAGAFNVYNKQHAAVLKKAGKYQLAPVTNGALKSRFMPAYFQKKEFGNIFMVSAGGNHLARFTPEAKNENSGLLEIVNIADQKVLFKTEKAFLRGGDLGFASFSSELIKYSIDTKMECRYFYYFKHAGLDSATGEASLRLKLFVLDIEKLEEKAIMTLEINKPQDLYVYYLDSCSSFMISYYGKDSNAASLKLKSGSWIITRDLGGALMASERILRGVCCVQGPGGGSLYAFDPVRFEIMKYEIVRCTASDYMSRAESLFAYFPDYAFETLERLKQPAVFKSLSGEEARKLDYLLKVRSEEIVKIKTAGLLMSSLTYSRLKLYALCKEKIESYAKSASSLTGEENAAIMEIKKEAEKALENDK
ncbi:MAG TPA: hypothetical protein PKW98_07385 [Candidatus Wallbacteria bacterium]|nr:MAG: hypothetical protein BWY32_03278 [bacterium ADurb.Bin243]HOD40025.1 hypothetical protein [Candidatus Wallbacteria bacterium]HPG57624.1 hypothetical protein [Candidatus Wallbacteria bacterium]